MNVLFVTSWYPSKLQPTNGNFVEQHARAVASVGCNVKVVHLIFSNRVLLPQIELKTQSGVPVYHLFVPKLIGKSEKLKKRVFKQLTGKLEEASFTPDIIHGHVVFPAGQLALFLRDYFAVPLVYTEHWSGYKAVNSKLFTDEVAAMTKDVLSGSELIFPVSHELAETMKQKGFKGNYAIVNNTVDTGIFYPKEKEDSGEFNFLHVSNFHPRAKNTEGIIRAFVNADFKNATLTIAGDGDLEKLIESSKSENLDLSRITFLGSMDYLGVAELMHKSDCFVMFSNYENLPCVIAESHCCGRPVIATEVGGIPEMIDESNGLLIPADDENALIGAMQTVIEEKRKFDGMEISRLASERYSLEAIGKQFQKHYEEVIMSNETHSKSVK